MKVVLLMVNLESLSPPLVYVIFYFSTQTKLINRASMPANGIVFFNVDLSGHLLDVINRLFSGQ